MQQKEKAWKFKVFHNTKAIFKVFNFLSCYLFFFRFVMHHLRPRVSEKLLSRLHLQASVTRFVIQTLLNFRPQLTYFSGKNWGRILREKAQLKEKHKFLSVQASIESWSRTLTNHGLPTLAIYFPCRTNWFHVWYRIHRFYLPNLGLSSSLNRFTSLKIEFKVELFWQVPTLNWQYYISAGSKS